MRIQHIVYNQSFSLGDKVKIGTSHNGWPIFAKITDFKEEDGEMLIYGTNANGEFLHAKAYKDGQTLIYTHRNLAADKVGDFESGEKVIILEGEKQLTRHIVDVDGFDFYFVAFENGVMDSKSYSRKSIFTESERVGAFFMRQPVYYVTTTLDFLAVEKGEIIDKTMGGSYIIKPENSNTVVDISKDDIFVFYTAAINKYDKLLKERKREGRKPRA